MRSSWISECSLDDIDQKGLFQTPPFVRFLAAFRPELKQYSDQSLQSRMALYLWWEQIGWREYKEVEWDVSESSILFANDILSKPSSNSFQYRAVIIEWLRLKQGRNSLIKHEDILFEWLYHIDGKMGSILPNFFKILIDSRQDLKNSFDLTDQSLPKVVSVLDWWNRYGKVEYPRIKFSMHSCLENELNQFEEINIYSSLPLYLVLIYKERVDLQDAYDISNSLGFNGFIHWWKTYGVVEYSYIMNFIKDNLSQSSAELECSHFPHGVNVIGFPQGILGLGEDARLAGKVIHDLDIGSVFINAPIAGPDKIITPEVNIAIVEDTKYNVSLFCLPPTEMMRLALEGGQALINGPEYKIGAWPWELPHWPTAFSRVRNFVDEIWAQSEYVKSCFLKEGNTPVYKMPMAVTIPNPTANVRERIGYSNETFLFYLMFDGNSWLSRKNPLAGVLAFQKAFDNGKYDTDIGLVIKAMNVNRSDSVWQKIEAIAESDPRIKIVTERMSRQDVINLMSSCNCYISLHRSEGFGRVIAEAMLLGQPVVATNFSGNVDFCTPDTSFLVNGELIPLNPGDYIFSEGQYWCDPDIDEAASKLLNIYEDPLHRSKVSLAGKQLIEKNYSMEAVSRAYAERLQQIKNSLS